MNRYYLIHDRNKAYKIVQAYSLRSVRAYAQRAMGIAKPIIEDDHRDIQGLRNSGLVELPIGFGREAVA